MKERKKETLWQSVCKMKTSQKIEFTLAAIITLALTVMIIIHAWFNNTQQMETLTKIKAPATLDIKTGNKEDIENFELKNIDIEEIADSGSKCYVFCVKTGSTSVKYDIQLSHTTNIPLTYTLYRASEVQSTDSYDVDYVSIAGEDVHYYYSKSGSAISMTPLNPDTANASYYGRTLGLKSEGNTYYDKTYDSTDDPEIYAVPLYSQAKNLDTLDADYDFFILELTPDTSTGTNFNKWNEAKNNKETDMIFISASKATQ